MDRHESKRHKLQSWSAPRSLAPLVCLLPLFSGACSWAQALQDNFKMPRHHRQEQMSALPLTETPVRMLYPDGAHTVEQAVSYMLEPHAYHPAYPDTIGDGVAQRGFIGNFSPDPVPLSVAMTRLLGADGQIMLDRERKLYAFRLRHPDEPGIAFSELVDDAPRAASGAGLWEQPDRADPAADPRAAAEDEITARVVDSGAADAEREANAGLGLEGCRSIQFRNRAMLSTTVREYFLECGFNEVFWKIGAPGRYVDYRLLQNMEVPLPERHHDLIKLLQSRFGINTLIHDDNRVEFHDNNSVL